MTFRTEFEHRDELLRSAIDEFCTHGYDAASINRILADAGVSKGQLYHHFRGKEGLYLALVEWMIDEKVAWLAGVPMDLDGDLVTVLGAQVRASLAFAAARPDVERLSRALLAERGRPIYEAVVTRFSFDPSGALGHLLAQRAGELHPDLSPDFAQRLVLLLVNRLPELLDLTEPADLDLQLEELLSFLRRGLLRD